MSARILYLLIGLILTLIVLPTTILAQTPQAASTSATPSSQFNPQSPQYANLVIINIIHALSCLGEGISIIGQPCLNYSISANSQGVISAVPILSTVDTSGGAVGTLIKGMIAISLTPPASGVQSLASWWQNGPDLISPARAQVGGTGAAVIQPVQKLWQLFRNVAYLGFVIVFVTAGLMIMFRQRLNPQVVISVQNALPGLVVGLIVVTFSYFIAGLIIDLAFVLAQLFGIVVVAGLAPASADAANIIRDQVLNQKNIFNFFTDFTLSGDAIDAARQLGTAVGNSFAGAPQGRVVTGFILAAIGGLICLPLVIASPICAAAGGAVGLAGPEIIIPALVWVILFIALLNAMFRLFFGLIGAYVAIILNTIFGPLLILFSAVPGRSNQLTNWLRSLLANVLVFPVTFGLFVLVAAILNFGQPWQLTDATSPFRQTLPLLGGLPELTMRYLLAYGLLLASPGIPEFIRELIAQPSPPQLAKAVGETTGAGVGGITSLVGRVAKIPQVRPG